MSRYHVGAKTFTCFHDHSQTESCPGHTLDVTGCASSDTVMLRMDGEHYLTMDDGIWCALVEIIKEHVIKKEAS